MILTPSPPAISRPPIPLAGLSILNGLKRVLRPSLAIFLFAVPTVRGMSAKTRPASPQARPRYSIVPFDPSVQVLPRDFRGHDPEQVYAALVRAKLAKDQFESSEAYSRRIETLKNQPILGSLTLQSLFAFDLELFDRYRLPLDASYSGVPVRPTYDADNERMAVSLESNLILGSDFQLYYFRSKSKVAPTGSYVGSNVMGVTRPVRSYRYESYCLAVTHMHALSIGFSMTSERARAVRDRVRLLLVGRLVEPYVLPDEVNGWSAKLDHPLAYVFDEHQIRFNPEELLVYDPATGEMLGRELLSTAALEN